MTHAQCPHDMALQDLIDGRLAVPQGPGLGIEINWDAVQRYRIDT